MKPSPILRAAVERVFLNADMQRYTGIAPRVGPEIFAILKGVADTERQRTLAHNAKVRNAK